MEQTIVSPKVAGVRRVQFRVHGIPVTQGSMKAFLPPGGKFPIVTHSRKPQLRSWRDAVASEALRARRGRLLEGPLAVMLTFLMPSPGSRPAELRTDKQEQQWKYPWRGADLDKLVRAALDAMTGVLFLDDAQIVRVAADKEYSTDPGLKVVVEQLV